MSEGKVETGAPVTGSLSGILASACCVGPLVKQGDPVNFEIEQSGLGWIITNLNRK